jgi:hypothetical protein
MFVLAGFQILPIKMREELHEEAQSSEDGVDEILPEGARKRNGGRCYIRV